MGPLEQVKPWNTKSVTGVHKFLHKAWRLLIGEDGKLRPAIKKVPTNEARPAELERILHKTIKKVTEDIDSFKFHTAIAALMTFVNEAAVAEVLPCEVAEKFVLLLAPFAPHLGEELWERLGHRDTLAYAPWPQFDPELARSSQVTIAVQVNGKLRDTLEVEPDIDDAQLLSAAKGLSKVQQAIAGKKLAREIVVKGRLVNLVVQ